MMSGAKGTIAPGSCKVVGFRVWGLGFGVWGLGFGVWGLGFGVWGLGFEAGPAICFRLLRLKKFGRPRSP